MQAANGSSAFVRDAAQDLIDLRELVLAQGLMQVASWSFEAAGAIAGSNPWSIAGLGADQNSYRAFRIGLGSLDAPVLATPAIGSTLQEVS